MKIECNSNAIAAGYILQDYFLAKAIIGRMDDEFVTALADCYGLSENYTQLLIASANKEREISSAADYGVIIRAQQYRDSSTGRDSMAMAAALALDDLDPSTEHVLGLRMEDIRRIKGRAYEFAEENKLFRQDGCSIYEITRRLSEGKPSRLVPVMRICGFMMCSGILFREDKEAGTHLLRSCARWNDIASLLPLMKQDEDRGRAGEEDLWQDYCIMRTLADNSTEQSLAGTAAELYMPGNPHYENREDTLQREVEVLRSVFASGSSRLLETVYDPLYASVLYAENISPRDKEKILSGADMNRSRVMNLPFVADSSMENLCFSADEFLASAPDWMRSRITESRDRKPWTRDIWLADYVQAQSDETMYGNALACICSDSKFVRDAYRKAICAGLRGHAACMDIAKASLQDVCATSMNVFFRGIASDFATGLKACIIICTKGVSENTLRAAADFLDPEMRRHYYLQDLDITLDLSKVPVICITDPDTAKDIMPLAVMHVHSMPEPAREEREEALASYLAMRQKERHMSSLRADRGVLERLSEKSLDEAAEALERIMRGHMGGELIITAEMLSADMENNSKEPKGTVGFNTNMRRNN